MSGFKQFFEMLIQNPQEIFPLGTMLNGDFENPLTETEFKQFLQIQYQDTRLLDYYNDVNEYIEKYNRWKRVKGRLKSIQNRLSQSQSQILGRSTQSLDADDLHDEDEDSLYQKSQKISKSIKNQDSDEVSEKQAVENTEDDTIVPSWSKPRNLKNIKRDISSESLGQVVQVSVISPLKRSKSSMLLIAPSMESLPSLGDPLQNENFPKPTASIEEQLVLSNNQLAHLKRTAKTLNQGRPKSEQISEMAKRIVYTYHLRDSPKYLNQVNQQKMFQIMQRYVPLLETADKTGLKFVPSPSKVFRPILSDAIKVLQQDIYPQFLQFTFQNKIELNTVSGVKYVAPRRRLSYFTIMIFLAGFIGVVVGSIISKRVHDLTFISIIPLFFVILNSILIHKRQSIFYWWMYSREIVTVSQQASQEIDRSTSLLNQSLRKTQRQCRIQDIDDPILRRYSNVQMIKQLIISATLSVLISLMLVICLNLI